jgi:hypothetical protein
MTQAEALNQFKKDYPMVTMGDLQSFTLGMQSREPLIQEYIRLIEEIQDTLKSKGDYPIMIKWIDEQLELI